MLKPLIIANWKMNPSTFKEAEHLFEAIEKGIKGVKNVEVIICPPFVWLGEFCGAGPLGLLKSKAKSLALQSLKLGAQNCHWEMKGAYTGEVSPLMLKDLGCEYVIVGHSERRKYFGESDEIVNGKLKSVLKARLRPVLCVGEETRDGFGLFSGEEKSVGEISLVVQKQLEEGLKGIPVGRIKDIAIAYEPLWAIGTGLACSPDEALKANLLIKKNLVKLYSRQIAEQTRIIYGGSVTFQNAADYIKEARMSGLLIGGASLNASEFIRILEQLQ